ncbi:hypothetical protein AAG906_041055 [Vitis piasezkii]
MNLSELGEDASLQTAAEVQNNHSEGGELFDLNSLPPGYRFNPTDAEIIVFYLRKKLDRQSLPPNKIIEVDLYAYSPDELAGCLKYPNGQRPKRSVGGDGYWKATGADKEIKFEDRTVGYRKVLVFYRGSVQNGVKTNWIMHEFRVAKHPEPPRISGVNDMRLDDCVLCRVYRKDERIYKRSRHESRLDESGPSSSKIPRRDLLNHNPNEANNRYEEQYSYNNIQMPLQTQQPQPRTEIFQAPQEHDHFALQSNTPQDHMRSSTLNHNPNEANNRYEEQYSYNNIQMPLQTQQPQPRTEIFQTPQERDHFALQSNTQFPILDPSVVMPLPTPHQSIHSIGNEFGGQGLDNFGIMNGTFGNSSFDAGNNIDFANVPGFDSTNYGNPGLYPMIYYVNDATPMSSNMNGNYDHGLLHGRNNNRQL